MPSNRLHLSMDDWFLPRERKGREGRVTREFYGEPNWAVSTQRVDGLKRDHEQLNSKNKIKTYKGKMLK